MLLRCDCLLPFYWQIFCNNNVNRAQCDLPLYFYTHFSLSMFCYMSHTHAYSFSWGFWQLWFPELHLYHLCLIFFFTFFCHLVAHQHLTWAHYLLPWPFQNSLLYCGLQIFSIPLFFVIFYFIFCAAFKTVWFRFFTNVIVYFISISENFATIILQELSVLFLGKFFLPIIVVVDNILLQDAHMLHSQIRTPWNSNSD